MMTRNHSDSSMAIVKMGEKKPPRVFNTNATDKSKKPSTPAAYMGQTIRQQAAAMLKDTK